MWQAIHIDMTTQTSSIEQLPAEYMVKGGRGLIAQYLSAHLHPITEPCSPENSIIFATGIFSGTSLATCNRLSVGCKSPLSDTIKESNAGGMAAFALAKLGIRYISITGKHNSPAPVVLIIAPDAICFVPAPALRHMPTSKTCATLHAQYGTGNAIICVGPAAEQGALFASLHISDMHGIPTRACGREGAGAVLAAKGIKAIVIALSGTHRPKYYNKEVFDTAVGAFTAALAAQNQNGNNVYSHAIPSQIPSNNKLYESKKPQHRGHASTKEHTYHLHSGQHPCQPGCTIQCPKTQVSPSPAPPTPYVQGARPISSSAGQQQGLTPPSAITLACNEAGIDAFEMQAILNIGVASGFLPNDNEDEALALIDELCHGSQRSKVLLLGAQHFARTQRLHMESEYGSKGTKLSIKQVQTIRSSTPETKVQTEQPHGKAIAMTAGTTQRTKKRQPYSQELMAAVDSLGICSFASMALTTPQGQEALGALFAGLSGMPWTMKQLLALGEETLSLERSFAHNAAQTTSSTKYVSTDTATCRAAPTSPKNVEAKAKQ